MCAPNHTIVPFFCTVLVGDACWQMLDVLPDQGINKIFLFKINRTYIKYLATHNSLAARPCEGGGKCQVFIVCARSQS